MRDEVGQALILTIYDTEPKFDGAIVEKSAYERPAIGCMTEANHVDVVLALDFQLGAAFEPKEIFVAGDVLVDIPIRLIADPPKIAHMPLALDGIDSVPLIHRLIHADRIRAVDPQVKREDEKIEGLLATKKKGWGCTDCFERLPCFV